MDNSLFAVLPPEIRAEIWKWTFTTPYAFTLQHGQTQHALTKTCREIRDESLDMFYSTTKFNAHLDEGPMTPLLEWFKVIGSEKVLLLHELHIWDIHMRITTLRGQHGYIYGKDLTNKPHPGLSYELVEDNSYDVHVDNHVADLFRALERMGLHLGVVCVDWSKGQISFNQTSTYAILSLQQHNDQVRRKGREDTGDVLRVSALRVCLTDEQVDAFMEQGGRIPYLDIWVGAAVP